MRHDPLRRERRYVLLLTLAVCGAAAACREDPVHEPAAGPALPEPHAPGQAARPASAPPSGLLPRFSETSDLAGVEFARYDDIVGQHRLIEANGGGVALFDYDRNGWIDVFFTDGCRLPPAERDGTRSNQMFRNLGSGRFERAPAAAGLVAESYFNGCTAGDYDSDGFDDLYVTAFGRNRCWRNNGDGSFTELTDELNVGGGNVWSTSAAFADLNRDGDLDLYVVNYVEYRPPFRLCRTPGSPDGYEQCPPTMFPAEDDSFYLSDGRGGFREAAVDAGLVGDDGKGLGVLVFDADQDGWPDVYVANDGTPNFLFVNRTSEAAAPSEQDGSVVPLFREEAMHRGVALNRQGKAEASMGIASGDYDANGWLDFLCTHFFAETNTLYQNTGGGLFEDATGRSRLGPPSRTTLGFGAEFLDWDNDGWLDLFITNGHVDDVTWRKTGESYRMKPHLFRNERDGTFTEVTQWAGPYFSRKWVGRGLAVGDLENDGDLDVVVSHQLDPSPVLRNDTSAPHRGVVIELIGRGSSNRSAFGARVEAQGLGMTLVREVVGGGSFQSASDRRVHIGLGEHELIPALRVRWPSGQQDEWADVAPGHYVAIEEGPMLAVPTPLPPGEL